MLGRELIELALYITYFTNHGHISKNKFRNGLEQLPIATKGEDFFGLTHPDVQQLLIKLGSYAQPNLSGKKSAVDNDPTICWEAYKFRCTFLYLIFTKTFINVLKA